VTLFKTGVVQAAGGAVWQRSLTGSVEILLVHRPRYDDWTLPKGKLEADERHDHAALREVEEETGMRCVIGPELRPTSYRDRKGRAKVVRYWAMTVSGGQFHPTDEVDETRWVPIADAPRLLSYERDIDVVAALAAAV